MSSDLMLMLWDSFVETVIMVGLSGFIGSVFGIPLGILLHVTDNGGVHPMPIFNKVLGWIINAVRSTPFIICSWQSFRLRASSPAPPSVQPLLLCR